MRGSSIPFPNATEPNGNGLPRRSPGPHLPAGAAWLLDARTEKVSSGTAAQILDKVETSTAAQAALFAD